jgi:thiol-disulfide isomerase/thioredoxin
LTLLIEVVLVWMTLGQGAGEPAVVEEKTVQPPFSRRLPLPPLPENLEWLNVSRPLTFDQFRGRFVLLDFWTYCCINCMHILPELKKLERAYPKELVVIGVHSAKFVTERDSRNITDAILRYDIEHPVINDSQLTLWKLFGVHSWPTVVLIDPEGQAVWGRSGEFESEEVDAVLRKAIPYYRQQGSLRESPLGLERLADRQTATPLRFPGKVLADEASGRLFVADSNHHRVVVASLTGELLDTVGTGTMGRSDGEYHEAQFSYPQGMALAGDTLYVADTENHLLRAVSLTNRRVSTIAGTGRQGREGWPGAESAAAGAPRFVGPPGTTPLNSPWALCVHEADLFVAMAGAHQIWKVPLGGADIGPYAGNGREDIVDGLLLPPKPFLQKPVNPATGELLDPPGYSSFAQPSGLATDGTWLFVADSEGSSIRAVPFEPGKRVRTIVGTSHLPRNRLFVFGDQDGPRSSARLQHPLDVVYHDGNIYVADTYNNKIKCVNARTGAVNTLVGTGREGAGSDPAEFNEPGGLAYASGRLFVADTNNHLIRTVDLSTKKISNLTIVGLTAPNAKL